MLNQAPRSPECSSNAVLLPERFRVGYAFGGTSIDHVRSPAMGGEMIPEILFPSNLRGLIGRFEPKPRAGYTAHLQGKRERVLTLSWDSL